MGDLISTFDSYNKDLLVIANPGTGKTTELAKKVIELINSGVKEKDILCITFTTKAAKEMSEKIYKTALEKDIKINLNDLAIHTFHSYAYDYLESIGEEYNVISNNILRFSIFKTFEKLNAFNYSEEYVISDIVPKTENAIRYLKSFGITPDDIKRNMDIAKKELEIIYNNEKINTISQGECEKFLEYFLEAYENYEKSKPEGFIDYADMLLEFIRKYDKNTRHYKHVLVDELQDVNELEAKIAILSGDILFLVGDRKQAIFGFQGGSVKNFDKFRERAMVSTLSTNYRSTENILKYSKTHFLSNTKIGDYNGELQDFKSYNNTTGDIVKVCVAENTENAAVKLTAELSQNNPNEKIAIITRTNGQLLKISKMLDAKNIPYTSTISNSTSVHATKEIIKFLKGLFYDNFDIISSALFTPFSGLSMKEAFDAISSSDKDLHKLENFAKAFFDMRKNNNIENLRNLFETHIMPISASINKEYFITSVALLKNIQEFFEVVSKSSKEDLFHYLEITEESYEPIGKAKGITLTTVHKAKGLEFDRVVYIPKKTRNNFSFVDAVVYSILKSKNIDIKDELEEEEIRIDFVAFTRSKKELYIVVNPKIEAKYYLDNLSTLVDIESDEIEPFKNNYDEAYHLFVSKRFEDAKKLLEKREPWLRDLIYDYFRKLDKISFSLVEQYKKPYDFFKNNILGIRFKNIQQEKGINAHKIASGIFNRTIDEKSLDEEEIKIFNNIKSILSEVYSMGYKQYGSEVRIATSLDQLLNVQVSELQFIAFIDAVFVDNTGKYLILDYKTDKTDDHESTNKKQLIVYKKTFAKYKKINVEDVSTAVAYISLKGNINTGKLDYKLTHLNKTSDNKLWDNFVNDVKELIEDKNNPELFIKKLIEDKNNNNEPLLDFVKRELMG
ncbi:MAG: UvrD-helicase domain-containing protein [Thermoplasmata archaeon]